MTTLSSYVRFQYNYEAIVTSYNLPPGYMINPVYHRALADNNQSFSQSYKRYDNTKKDMLSEKDHRKRGYAPSTSSSSTKKTKQIKKMN
jgi:hypothetical protein